MIDVVREIDAPAPSVWSVLASPERWTEWGPSVTAVECTDDLVREGSRGRVRTPIGIWVPFEVTRVAPGRAWSWKVAGLPATDHRVEALTPDRSRVVLGVPSWAAPYAVVCRVALRRIAAVVAS